MKTVQLYVETSVWNQPFHDDRPDWKQLTNEFFNTIENGNFEIFISEVVANELSQAPKSKYMGILGLLKRLKPDILELTEESVELAEKYFGQGIFKRKTRGLLADANHASICTVEELDYLVSWNYRHLFKARNIELFNLVNMQNGYFKPLRIVTPEAFIDVED